MRVKHLGRISGSVALSALAIVPIIVGFPRIVGRSEYDISVFLVGIVLAFCAGVFVLALRGTDESQKRLMARMAILAAITITAGQIMGLNRRFSIFVMPIPHVLGPLLHAQGESAFDAAEFELYCEYWAIIAVLASIVLILLRRSRNVSMGSK